jgi:hypothetical protein
MRASFRTGSMLIASWNLCNRLRASSCVARFLILSATSETVSVVSGPTLWNWRILSPPGEDPPWGGSFLGGAPSGWANGASFIGIASCSAADGGSVPLAADRSLSFPPLTIRSLNVLLSHQLGFIESRNHLSLRRPYGSGRTCKPSTTALYCSSTLGADLTSGAESIFRLPPIVQVQTACPEH